MILELENICKEYMQGKIPVPVLKNINFSMEEGARRATSIWACG